MRAGLDIPSGSFGGTEPRGDMDVMLSMRTQGLITPATSSVSSRHVQSSTAVASQPLDHSYASSISSHRSQATVSRFVAPGPVSAIKGMFTGSTRSRSTSIDSQHDLESIHDESFGSMGSHLLSRTRLNAPDGALGLLPVVTPLSPEHRLDQKILVDKQSLWAAPDPLLDTKERPNRTLSLTSVSLQPPPRRRWTSLSSADQDNTTMHMNGNSHMTPINSGNLVKAEAEVPSSLEMSNFNFGSPVQRPRAPSIQSVSTLASIDNSSSTKRSSKRWSRQGVLPRRLTPPSGPPPSVPSNQISGPALIDRTPSESSSRYSASSGQSMISSLPSFPKRASGSSFLSINGTSASPSPTMSRPTSIHSHRTSIPPPPRPAPTSALPPAPDQEASIPDPPKSSLRDPVGQRAFRLSMVAPRPPPSAVLPPRPDEVEYKPTHRRNSSAGNLTSIPASPIPKPLTLPASPGPHISSLFQSSQPISRRTSIKQRLRILSAPVPPPALSSSPPPIQEISFPSSSTGTSSLPPTPIAEKIVQYQNDMSFLHINTPSIPYFVPSRALPSLPEPYPEVEITSLSPPPRRGSKQVSLIELDSETPAVEEEKHPVDGERRLMSLSRPGSVISLGIVSM